mmetsp:Transcript_4902/g.11780  ORF Transcript_4902/g.11780 Transcript_4902/m.11780 type:complete len:87 (+) Transcript_4902:33-293(+)
MFNILESTWLKAKLADNADVFGSNLTGSSPSQLTMPTNIPALTSAQMSTSGVAMSQLPSNLRAGGDYNHMWDKSASCAWNSVECKI